MWRDHCPPPHPLQSQLTQRNGKVILAKAQRTKKRPKHTNQNSKTKQNNNNPGPLICALPTLAKRCVFSKCFFFSLFFLFWTLAFLQTPIQNIGVLFLPFLTLSDWGSFTTGCMGRIYTDLVHELKRSLQLWGLHCPRRTSPKCTLPASLWRHGDQSFTKWRRQNCEWDTRRDSKILAFAAYKAGREWDFLVEKTVQAHLQT